MGGKVAPYFLGVALLLYPPRVYRCVSSVIVALADAVAMLVALGARRDQQPR